MYYIESIFFCVLTSPSAPNQGRPGGGVAWRGNNHNEPN